VKALAKLEFVKLNKIYNQADKKKKKKAQTEEQVHAVKNLDLVIDDGSFVGILGPSGCGKSTTLRMVAGLEEISGGQILVDGAEINNVAPKDRGIGLAFEDYALYPPKNVYENIAFCLRAKKVPKEEIDTRVREIARIMKLEDLIDQPVSKLGGGQKQRVNIARALVRNPKILLLDEPLSHLDGKMRQVLRMEIKRLHNAIKCTTIIVTHDQMEAMSLADKIAIMDHGVLQQYGTPDEIYNDPVNRFVADFIGEPPMNLLDVTAKKSADGFEFLFKDSTLRLKAPQYYDKVLHDGDVFTLGIRPTSMEIVKDAGAPYDAEFPVEVFENLGEERIISIKVGENFLTIVTDDETRYKSGDPIRIKANEQLVYLFDVKTGERIRG
jgi:multiple sugar transport system ATP-binding protein